MTDSPSIKTAEQTYDPDATEMIVDILKDISPEYADSSFNLIDCIERLAARAIGVVALGKSPDESADTVMHLLAESIEEIHKAMVRDDDNEIEKL